MHLLWNQLQTCRLARALLLDRADLRSQPAFERLLQLGLTVIRLEILDGLSRLIQLNEVAGNRRRVVLLRYEVNQLAFVARVGAVWIAVV